MIDIDYIREIRERVPAAALYEQLAEECVELAHAALKMARYLRGENPTPLTEEQIRDSIAEEASDVHTVAKILDIKGEPFIVNLKLNRWHDRLAERSVKE